MRYRLFGVAFAQVLLLSTSCGLSAAEEFCPKLGDACADQESIDSCIAAYNECGEGMGVARSCPPGYFCSQSPAERIEFWVEQLFSGAVDVND